MSRFRKRRLLRRSGWARSDLTFSLNLDFDLGVSELADIAIIR